MSARTPLSKEIVQFLKSKGIVKPTPIQEKAIPLLLEGTHNSLLLAPTGSGKTEAALLPLLNKLQQMSKQKELFGFYILYITPLKALNRDVFKRMVELCEHLGLTADVRHGDTTQYARRKQAIYPPNLLITTPETLQAILPGKRLKYHLRTVFSVVVDEVHNLASSKRGTQLSLGLERLERLIGSEIMRIGLSATVGNPKEVSQLLGGKKDIKTVWAGYDNRKVDLRVKMPSPNDQHKKLVKKLSYPIHSVARLETIVDLIEKHQSTLVFTNTRSFAEVLGAKMRALSPPYKFDVHHGSLSKNSRLTAEDNLKSGISKAIIATSSLELGIDIGQADLVIQYSSPREVSRLVQRVGRSGHGIGRTSKGVVISTVNLDDISESGIIIKRARLNKVEDARIPKKAWDVLCHQITGVLLDCNEIEKESLLSLVTAAYPFSEVTSEELDSLLEFMEGRYLLNQHGSEVSKGSRTRMFYYERLSTIPDTRQVNAVDITTRTSIGVLDEDYVAANVEPGLVFVIRGRPWNVVIIDDESGEVMCAPATGTDTDAPRWVGEMIPVPYEVASDVAKLWNSIFKKENRSIESLLADFGIFGEAINHIVETLTKSKDILGDLPSPDLYILETFGSGIVLHSPLGTRANETLGIVIASLLTTRLGIAVAVERDPYRILFTASDGLESNHVLDVLRDYSGEQASYILRLSIKQTQNFASRFVHVARRMDIVRKDAKSKQIPVRYLIKSFEGTPVFEEAMREVLEEKMDEKRAMEVFDRYSNGSLEIREAKTLGPPSPLARLIIEEKTRFEVMGEITEEDEVLRMMEERLLSKKFRLVCMAENHWNSVRTIKTLDEIVTCPICESKMIAVVQLSDKDFTKLLDKRLRGKISLTKEEEKKYNSAALTAELVSRYGKTALLVLAGRGIGATTASRILSPSLKERLEILRAIAKGELQYERTRPYW